MTRPSWRMSLLLLLGVWALMLSACDKQALDAMRFKGANIQGVSWGHQLSLSDQYGQRRDLKDFQGKVLILYFGFTQCPDVCPTALTRAVEVMKGLGPLSDQVQLLFVTLDPERDKPEMLQAYMQAFDARFLALTGSVSEVKKAADEFRIYFKKVPTGSSYTVDHSAVTYLLDRQGRLRVMLRHEQSAADYLADIRQLLKESSK